jgi:hypothetical protein
MNYLLVVPEGRHFNHKLLVLPESIILEYQLYLSLRNLFEGDSWKFLK